MFGAGEAGCFPNLTRMLSAWLPVSERVKAQAVMWAFGRWGGRWRRRSPSFVIITVRLALGLCRAGHAGRVWVAAFLPWFRNDPAEHKGVNAEELKLLENSRALVLHDHGMPWYKLLLQRDIAFLGLQYFGFSYTWYFYVTWLPTWLQKERGIDPPDLGALCHDPAGALAAWAPSPPASLPLWIPRKWVAIAAASP